MNSFQMKITLFATELAGGLLHGQPQPMLNVHHHKCLPKFPLLFAHFSSGFLVFVIQEEEECEKGQKHLWEHFDVFSLGRRRATTEFKPPRE